MKKERKIIFECYAGSMLYGTNTAQSDKDYFGVFLPSSDDVLSLGNCPTEWSMNQKISTGERNNQEDVDRKYYSLQRFLKLLAEGQPGQIEMLFAPDEKTIVTSPEWQLIKSNKDLFLSQNSIKPFLGFVKAQAYKSQFKGDNLNKLRKMIQFLDVINGETNNSQLIIYKSALLILGAIESKTDSNEECLEITGQKFEYGLKIKDLYKRLCKLEARYGTRSETAATHGVDFKSLLHCYRLLHEADELLTTGKLTLPLPELLVKFLLTIKEGKYVTDYFIEITKMIDNLENKQSPLQNNINWSKINNLCQEILYNHLYESSK